MNGIVRLFLSTDAWLDNIRAGCGVRCAIPSGNWLGLAVLRPVCIIARGPWSAPVSLVKCCVPPLLHRILFLYRSLRIVAILLVSRGAGIVTDYRRRCLG
jgi:hypothetical protein